MEMQSLENTIRKNTYIRLFYFTEGNKTESRKIELIQKFT